MKVTVNGEVIQEAAIEFELSRLLRFYAEHMDESQVREQMDSLKARAIDQAIGAKLLILEAAKMDIPVSEDDVEASFKQMIESVGGDVAFKGVMAQQGLDEKGVKDNIKEGRRVDHLVASITAGISDPTEEEMKTHFEEHTDEYMKPERSQGQHILIKPEADDDDSKEAAWKKLEGLKKELDDGAEFADLAKEHSDCPSGKQGGGSLGWFTRGMMVPEFDNAVFSMEIGALSDIIETQFGYHLIVKTGHEKGEAAEYGDSTEKIREFLRHVKRGEVLSSYVRDLREKAEVEIEDDKKDDK
jgi:peptidyl-prolyl cis-trans isomerase C